MLKDRKSFAGEAVIEKIDKTVYVPADVFQKCLRIKSEVFQKLASATISIDGMDFSARNIEVKIEEYSWYAPGVGLVKHITKENVDDKKIVLTLELESFQK